MPSTKRRNTGSSCKLSSCFPGAFTHASRSYFKRGQKPLSCSTIYELLTEDFTAVWLKLLLEAVTGWAPWGEDCEKTFERWSGCWGKSGMFPGVRRGKRVVVSWDMCEDRGKARVGQWPCQGRALCWMGNWPEVVSVASECGGSWGVPLPSFSIPFLPPPQAPAISRGRKPSTLRAHRSETHTQMPHGAVLSNFLAHGETTSSVKTSDTCSLLCLTN